MYVGLDGITETLKAIEDKAAQYTEQVKRKLTVAGGELISRAVKITPLETGELRARSFIDKPRQENGSWVVDVGYEHLGAGLPKTSKGNRNEYAVYVHERMDLKHKIGQAKFLETAFKDFQDEMLEYLKPDESNGGNDSNGGTE